MFSFIYEFEIIRRKKVMVKNSFDFDGLEKTRGPDPDGAWEGTKPVPSMTSLKTNQTALSLTVEQRRILKTGCFFSSQNADIPFP